MMSQEQHAEIRRLIALNCITFTEIGKRVGCSRERVRQLAKKQNITGKERLMACLIPQNIKKVGLDKYLERFSALGLKPEVITTNGNSGVLSRRLRLLGRVCLIRKPSKIGYGGRDYYSLHPTGNAKIEFSLWELNNGDFLVIPRAEERKTAIVLNRPYRKFQRTYNHRTNWRKYLNAWDLLHT